MSKDAGVSPTLEGMPLAEWRTSRPRRVPWCTQCHRVGEPDGYWRTPDTNVCQDAQVTLVNKVCPDCARRAYARGAYRYPTEQAD